MSETSSEVNSLKGTRTSLTGKPISYQHDPFSATMLSHGGGFTNVGANLLPAGYTDDSLVHIPIKVSDFSDESTNPATEDVQQGGRKQSLFGKLSGSLNKKKSADEIKVVMMSRGQYLKYWAKGEDGKFLPSVVEPPGGRAEWIKKQLILNAEWKK